LAGILHLTGATNLTAALTTPRPTTSPTAADPQDPLINDLAGALLLGPKPKSVYRNRYTDLELDPRPSCYQLNVACNLSERPLLINDFAGAPILSHVR
jgi:hypothetical protein